MLYGVDIGGTKIAFAAYDQALNCLLSKQIATPTDYSDFISTISMLVNQADAKFKCQGEVGIGFPGAINPGGQTLNCANVTALKDQPVIQDLGAALRREFKLENDANCFLLSECFGGSADGCATVLGVTLGTGVGGAIFANGGIIRGQNAFAGEIGHYPLPATVLKKYPELPSLTCGCGREMCLETYVSGTGLSNLYQHYTHVRLTGPDIVKQYQADDKTAIKVVNIYFDILAAGLGTAMLLLDADAIVFGGGLSNLEMLNEALVKRLPEHLLSHVKLPRIVNAHFGSEGGVRGAALLNYTPTEKMVDKVR